MPNRRKTKSERELVADIRKSAKKFCEQHNKGFSCGDCPLTYKIHIFNYDCVLAYVHYILDKANKGED